MLEKEKQEILNENDFLNNRKNALKKTKFELDKRRFFIIGIILAIGIIIAFYFISSYSNVFYVSVSGNHYLEEKTIRELTKVTDEDKFLLVNPKQVEDNLKENKIIEECTVSKVSGNLIKVEVKEHKIIGYTNLNGKDAFVLDNSDLVEINNDNIYLISEVPLIRGYDLESIVEVAKGLNKVDKSIINEISEIERYPFSYDKNMMKIVMRDGNYIFVSCQGVYLLDMTSYYTVIADIGSINKVCLYLDEVTNTFQYRGCPWDSEVVEVPIEA